MFYILPIVRSDIEVIYRYLTNILIYIKPTPLEWVFFWFFVREDRNYNERREKEKIDFKYNLGIYFSLAKKYIFWIIGLLLISIIVEAGLNLNKYLFKLIIDNGTEFSNGSLAQSEFIRILTIIAFVFLGGVLLRAIIKWFYVHFIIKIDSGLIFDLKNKFFDHLFFLDYEFHTTHKSGSLISRLSRGSRAIEMMTDIIVFQFAPLVFQLVIISITLAYFNVTAAVVILITVLVFIGYSYFIQYIQQTYNLKVNFTDDKEKGLISDVFTNIDSIKYYGKENQIKDKYYKASAITRLDQIKHWGFFRWWDFGHTVIIGLGAFFVVYYPVISFLKKEISIGTVVFIYTLFINLATYMFMFVFGMRNFYRALADFESLFQYAKVENKIKDKKDAIDLKINKGVIEFKNVSFKYNKNKIFNNFNLKIKKNEKVALVGHSGCGKTSLIKLLYRLYDINKGQILIDGTDICDVKQESLRSEMAIVPQECILFDDTIYNNIAFSKPDAKRKEIFAAMKFAQLDRIISTFSDKEKTIVGERGIKLSGGEKQRVSIARAILADKTIIVLDEATSSLDSKTEYEIQKDFQKLLKGRTSIIIAHRLSTIMNSDRVIVMDKGKIVQMGKHNTLQNKKGAYQELWNLQKNGYLE